MIIKQISIEAELWLKEEWNYQDDNTDVWVTLENGEVYGAAFFTFKNVETLRSNWKKSGEFFGGKYFSLKNSILVEECSRVAIEEVINHLVEKDQFFEVFELEDD